MTLPVFNEEEFYSVQKLLALKVAQMKGRKMEEGDWDEVYRGAKNIPDSLWSNLNIDVAFNGIGVEQKMLRRKVKETLLENCGRSLMHPSATRSLRPGNLDRDPNVVMKEVLHQYCDLINHRENWVREQCGLALHENVDMRTGVLLWRETLSEFMYFEIEMERPDPSNYWAEWQTTRGKGARKPSKSLWIYEKTTGRKRYSLTTEAGVKLQPYYDIPPANDPNLYFFQVIGEPIGAQQVRMWLTEQTFASLETMLGTHNDESLDQALNETIEFLNHEQEDLDRISAEVGAIPLIVSEETYAALVKFAPEFNDDAAIQRVLEIISRRGLPE